jgi:hypothetical protein
MSSLFTPVLHPRIELRKKDRPVKVADLMLRGGNPIARFNRWLAVKVTNAVGTMWCAYVFAALALVSLPAAIMSHNAVLIVSWISQTFLQLVLLSIIIVGQNVLAAASDKRAKATYEDADAVSHTALQIQDHLAAQRRAPASSLPRTSRPTTSPPSSSAPSWDSPRSMTSLRRPPTCCTRSHPRSTMRRYFLRTR